MWFLRSDSIAVLESLGFVCLPREQENGAPNGPPDGDALSISSCGGLQD